MDSTRIKNLFLIILLLYIFIFLFVFESSAANQKQWTESEIAFLKLNWIGNLPEIPADPSNKQSDNLEAAKFGHLLFFDKRFSKNGKVSCALCHIPEKAFTDGLAKAKAIGVTARSTPSIIGIAYSHWYFWDGRSDSLWSQALSPLEHSVEHGGNRSQYAHIIFNDPNYRKKYQKIFGALPDLANKKRFPEHAAPGDDNILRSNWKAMREQDQKAVTNVFVNIAKSIAAYQRMLIPSASRFDNYVATVLKSTPSDYLSKEEISGLKLFIGKAMCITCHQGPLFTNHGFHNVGAPDPANKNLLSPIINLFREKPLFDVGRYHGISIAKESEFNCLGDYSDASVNDCSELTFANTKYSSTLGAFKVPTLRNIVETAPYFQLGQFSTLSEVLNHYNNAPDAPVGHSELTPLGLTSKELVEIEAFLQSLSSPPAVAAEWLSNPH